MAKKPLSDEQRQEFLDKLANEQVNPKALETFDESIERAAKPKQSKPETPAASDSYSDRQTHSHKTEDTLD